MFRTLTSARAQPASDTLPAGSDYRAHLDGLRTLAVVLVILFHLGYSWMPGGFIGVDVFFVLSGYLITGVLLRELGKREHIRLSWFYSRRVRRLLAASLLVIGVVVVLANTLLNAVDQASVAGDAKAAALYFANWHAAAAGGEYFAPGDVPSPLIHFWSLSVEEQFYIVWPGLLFILWRATRRRRDSTATGGLLAAILTLLVASAVTSVITAGTTTSYYGTHTRAYQLLAGAALAVLALRWKSNPRDTQATRVAGFGAAAAGFVALIWLAAAIPGAADYPGVAGLGVTAASAALIAALEFTPIGWAQRAFGSAVPALLGRMSYSLYLWHWPVIVFAPLIATRYGFHALHDHRSVKVLVMLGLSAGSYYLVERPVRFKLYRRAPFRTVVAAGLTLSAIIAFAGNYALSPHGRFATEAFAARKDIAPVGKCPYTPENWKAVPAEPCRWRKGGPFVVALVGDSHAMQWQPALDVVAKEHNLTVIRVTRGGCPANTIAQVTIDAQGLASRYECASWRREIYRRLIAQYHPNLIYVETRSQVWAIRKNGHNYGPGTAEHRKLWSQGWDPTLRALTAGPGKVIVAKITPTMPFHVPACLSTHTEGTKACDARLSPKSLEVRYNRIIAGLPKRYPGVTVVDPTPIICPHRKCPAMLHGQIVHRDTNHISASYSRTVAKHWEAMLVRAGVRFP